MEVRQALIWAGLLLAGQATDVLTTAVDRARGALEAMPVSARLLDTGGLWLFWGIKVLLVVAVCGVLVLTGRWVKLGRPGARFVFRLALLSVQGATIAVTSVAFTNALLLGSLTT